MESRSRSYPTIKFPCSQRSKEDSRELVFVKGIVMLMKVYCIFIIKTSLSKTSPSSFCSGLCIVL